MAVHGIFDPVYEQVRKLGLNYQIKESGGSVMIRISSNKQQNVKQGSKEKFRFQTSRTFDGSSNLNWRIPTQSDKFCENNSINKPPFPTIDFFQCTPPPRKTCIPPPTPPPVTACILPPTPTTVTACFPPPTPPPGTACIPPPTPPLGTACIPPPTPPPTREFFPPATFPAPTKTEKTSSQVFPTMTRTPINPFRSARRIITYPKTPNMMKPSLCEIAIPNHVALTSNESSVLSTVPENYKEFVKVMAAVYGISHY